MSRNGIRSAKELHTPKTCPANPFPRISNANSEICTENVSTIRKFCASLVAGTVELISKKVDYNCYGVQESPRSRDCEDASFAFIGEQSVVVGPRQPFMKQVGRESDSVLFLQQKLT